MTVFIAIIPSILQKEKNEIGLTVYELKREMWKKQRSTSKWNNNAKKREIII